MAEFSELIKNFNKIRDYMRDFYIYGFKSRNDFSLKSARTYDNEKRRCESYLGSSMKWTYSGGNKVSFVSVDCSNIPSNPLYSAWKSKSFTANDIMLHFYILDEVKDKEISLEDLTNSICIKSGIIFDVQIVRLKCNEYVDHGILSRTKRGKGFAYKLADDNIDMSEDLIDAIKYFQGDTLGVIGSYILDSSFINNDLFVYKHNYIAHTLDDAILIELLGAIRSNKKIRIKQLGAKSGKQMISTVYPVKILVSCRSGRRYLCAYIQSTKRFKSYRLDSIKAVEILEDDADVPQDLQSTLERNLEQLWSASFDGETRNESFTITLRIDEENEQHIINRIKKESRGGELTRLEQNVFVFSKEVFDANEALPWIKTFIGRIISYKSTPMLERKLYADIMDMAKLYGLGESE